MSLDYGLSAGPPEFRGYEFGGLEFGLYGSHGFQSCQKHARAPVRNRDRCYGPLFKAQLSFNLVKSCPDDSTTEASFFPVIPKAWKEAYSLGSYL